MLQSGAARRLSFCAHSCVGPAPILAESALVPADLGCLSWRSNGDAVHEESDHLGSAFQHRCRRLPHQRFPSSSKLRLRDVSKLVLVPRRQTDGLRDAFLCHRRRYAGGLTDVSLHCDQGKGGLNGACRPAALLSRLAQPCAHPPYAPWLERWCPRPCITGTTGLKDPVAMWSRGLVAGFCVVV